MRVSVARSIVVLLFLAGLGLLAQQRNQDKFVRPQMPSATQFQAHIATHQQKGKKLEPTSMARPALPHRPLLWRKLCHCCHQLRASHSGSLSIPGRTPNQIGVVFTRLGRTDFPECMQ